MSFRLAPLSVAIMALCALAPSAAEAGTVSVVGSKLTHVAAPGQNSKLGVSYKHGEDSLELEVSEQGRDLQLTAGPGCRSDRSKVVCPRQGTTGIALMGGDGDDTLSNSTFLPAVLDGGAGHDTLSGGFGPDTLVGGLGSDTASYAHRSQSVIVDLDGMFGDDGAAGEGDSVLGDVEVILGGSGRDSLSGGPGPNTLSGGSATDRLDGGSGADHLDGGSGSDTLVSRETDADSVTCGSGDDDVMADPADSIAADCERVDVAVAAAPLQVSLPPPFAGVNVSGKPITMTRDGRAIVKISCPAGRTLACRGTVTIRDLGNSRASASTARAKRRSAVLGRRRFRIAPGQSKRVSVKLSRNGRHRVRRQRRVRCSVNVGVRGPDGKSVVTRKKVTLKAPKRGGKWAQRGRR